MIEQTKPRPKETLAFKMDKQKETFSFNPPVNFSEEGTWLMGVKRLEATNSIFNITDENQNFSVSAPSHWSARGGDESANKLQKFF